MSTTRHTGTRRRHSPPGTMTVPEVCAATGLHRLTVYAMIDRYLARAEARARAGLPPLSYSEVHDNEIVGSRWGTKKVADRAFVEAKIAGRAGVLRAPREPEEAA